MSDETARGSFDIDLSPSRDLSGRAGRFDFTKTWAGDVEGVGVGAMLSAGDPATGSAGYAALEFVDGTIRGTSGSFALVQLGLMATGQAELRYAVVPGSGTGALVGLTGELVLDGHDYTLTYTLPRE